MNRSILAKLVFIYVIVAMVLVGILGFTIVRAYRHELLDTRLEDISEKGSQLAYVLAQSRGNDRSAIAEISERISLEFDAAVFVANGEGTILMCTESDRVAGMRTEALPAALPTAPLAELQAGGTYLNRSTATTLYGLNLMSASGFAVTQMPGARPVYYVLIFSSLSSMERSYAGLMSSIWLPCALVFAAGIILILILNYQLTVPLMQMNSAAKEISKGNFESRVTVQTQDEVGQLAQSFNSMAKELADIDRTRKDFVANISHELRTPLTSINGFVQGILDGTIQKDEVRKYLEIVHAETQRLTSLTKEMLLISQVDANKIELEYTVYDQNELMRRTLLNLAHKIEQKGIEIEIELAPGRLMVNADQNRIEQVVINLLDNAIKFTPQGGTIRLSTAVKEGKCFSQIKDSGVGIPYENQPYVFDRFYTANKARSGVGSGTGLGLSIVKKIILLHKQEIALESEPGKGAAFSFSLELAPKKHFKKGEPHES